MSNEFYNVYSFFYKDESYMYHIWRLDQVFFKTKLKNSNCYARQRTKTNRNGSPMWLMIRCSKKYLQKWRELFISKNTYGYSDEPFYPCQWQHTVHQNIATAAIHKQYLVARSNGTTIEWSIECKHERK